MCLKFVLKNLKVFGRPITVVKEQQIVIEFNLDPGYVRYFPIST
jgi:hypothetical protein